MRTDLSVRRKSPISTLRIGAGILLWRHHSTHRGPLSWTRVTDGSVDSTYQMKQRRIPTEGFKKVPIPERWGGGGICMSGVTRTGIYINFAGSNE